jgi:hypothetical protein
MGATGAAKWCERKYARIQLTAANMSKSLNFLDFYFLSRHRFWSMDYFPGNL